METKLELKSINDILAYEFLIPFYQRGFRWTNLQVEQLLNDIYEFAQRDKKRGEFYCLQPIVVQKKDDNKYEVIDGQQRLTTIYLILSYFEKEHLRRSIKEAFKKEKFTINYTTRERSSKFLESISDQVEINEENIDFYHMSKAYTTIKSWFSDKDYNEHDIFLRILLAKQESNPVVVIWYEINEEDADPIEIFTRLNLGKIPLTNSELIKALLLKKENFEENTYSLNQILIATEWDLIEKQLQDDSFWYFIYNPADTLKYENRIEYIFDLMSNKNPNHEYYHTFNHFYKEKISKHVEDIWLDIKRFYLTFEEWYKDFELYHYIGFLIASVNSKNYRNLILEIKEKASELKKDEFRQYLKNKIKETINCQSNELEKLEYGDQRIKKILLLFNIQTILNSQNTNNRFPFNKFKIENWDVEHVRSKNNKVMSSYKERINWINMLLEYFTGKKDATVNDIPEEQSDVYNFCQKLFNLKNQEDKDVFEKKFGDLYKEIQEYFKENETEYIDSLSNLTLLDAETNRSYGNTFFPIKRKRIIENDKNGKFVPIATKNLFLKFYSKKLEEIMYWTEQDAHDYIEAIKHTLNQYLKR